MDVTLQHDSHRGKYIPAGQENYDVLYPPLPMNEKGNIVRKNPLRHPLHSMPSPSTLSRKRPALSVLTATPPRASRSSPIANIFSRTPRRERAKTSPPCSPASLSDEAVQVYEHFHQAMNITSSNATAQAFFDGSNDGAGHIVGSQRKHDHAHGMTPPSPTTEPVDSQEDILCDLQRIDSAACMSPAEEWDPPTPLQRGVASGYFQPSLRPSQHTRAVEANSPTKSESTDSWTGDEIFFDSSIPKTAVRTAAVPRVRALPHHLSAFPSESASPLPNPTVSPSVAWLRPLPPLSSRAASSRPRLFSPMPLRPARRSRFQGFFASSMPIAGVPLCMEEHPSSPGSDADEEDNSDIEDD